MDRHFATGPVLIVEDDPDTRAALAQLISDEGFPVSAVRGVQDAIALVDTQSFSLILTDVWDRGVPRWAEIESLVELAQPTPVGACTASRGEPPKDVGCRLAFFLEKPFQPEMLLQVVSRFAGDQDVVSRYRPQAEAYFEALAEKDWAALAALCAEDVSYFFPTSHPELGRKVEGRDAFVRYSKETLSQFEGLKFVVTSLAPLEQGLIAAYGTTWNGGAHSGAVVLRFHGEKISRIGIRTDVTQLAFASAPAQA